MLIRMFDREITQQELTSAAAARGIASLPVLHNSKEQPRDNTEMIDNNAVAALAGKIASAPHRLHVIYQLISVSVPMLSLYMDLEQADVLSYNRNGVRASRMINPRDLKRLLLESFSGLPMLTSAYDTCGTVTGVRDTVELIRRIYAGDTGEIDLSGAVNFSFGDITSAIRENPCVRCVLEDEGSNSVSYYGISDGERVFCVFPGKNGISITCGSARPVIDAVSRGWMTRCREQILAHDAASGELDIAD